jgi:hypothetical protein
MDTLLQEGVLDADQQMIGQHTEEEVGFNPPRIAPSSIISVEMCGK